MWIIVSSACELTTLRSRVFGVTSSGTWLALVRLSSRTHPWPAVSE